MHSLKNTGAARARDILRLGSTGVVLVAISFCSPARADDGDYSHHSVWFQGQYVPFDVIGGDNSQSPKSSGAHVGVAGGYAFRFAESLSVGLGLTYHRPPSGDEYHSATVVSVPLLFSFDPHVSRTVRLVVTASLGYQDVWGNHSYGGSAWESRGCEAGIDFGVAVQLAAKLELLASIGARVMIQIPFIEWLDSALPIGLGVRYTP